MLIQHWSDESPSAALTLRQYCVKGLMPVPMSLVLEQRVEYMVHVQQKPLGIHRALPEKGHVTL